MNEDVLLVEDCKRKDIKAFELLYKKYAARMKGIAYRYVGDQQTAEDVLQDAFVKVYIKIQTFENTGSFESWLKRIVVNTAIDFYKSSKKEIEKLSEYYYVADENDSTFFLPDDYSIEELTDTINKLPTGYKLVFNLYAIDGYSHKEIAETLKINEGTSKSQLFKAREFLKKELLQLKKIHHG